MSKLIELVNDVWTFGCKGDVLRLAEDELARLEATVKKLGVQGYKVLTEVAKGAESAAVRAEKAVEADVVDAAKAGKK